MKRIVICADGTWNDPDQVDEQRGKRRPTNVVKVARAVQARAGAVDQVVYYHQGVGTEGQADRLTGGAFGHGLEDNVRDLYRFILYNHVPGDELYLFGFSRGAYTVRTLAGFMHHVGLVRKNDDYYVPEMYRCYEDGIAVGSSGWDARMVRQDGPRKGTRRVEQVRECPPITFLGVWDTVGALGAPGFFGKLFTGDRYQYHRVGLNSHIQAAAHALALDERRAPFDATLFQRPDGWAGRLAQTWFAGAHTDIGGGYDWDGLANEALHWMVMHARREGLVFDDDYLSYFKTSPESTMHDSLTAMYKLSGAILRPVGEAPDAEESIHRSVLRRAENPACRYPDPEHGAAVKQRLERAMRTLPVVDTDPPPPVFKAR